MWLWWPSTLKPRRPSRHGGFGPVLFNQQENAKKNRTPPQQSQKSVTDKNPQIVSEPIGHQQTGKNKSQGLKTDNRSTKYSLKFYLSTLIPKGVLNIFRRDVFGEKSEDF
jgi:hypothetical protein